MTSSTTKHRYGHRKGGCLRSRMSDTLNRTVRHAGAGPPVCLMTFCVCGCPMQVTNRDLSTAVLRQFLPMLAAEHKEGRYKKQRQMKKQQRKIARAGQEQDAQQEDDAAAEPANEQPGTAQDAEMQGAPEAAQQTDTPAEQERPAGAPNGEAGTSEPSTSGRTQSSERVSRVSARIGFAKYHAQAGQEC